MTSDSETDKEGDYNNEEDDNSLIYNEEDDDDEDDNDDDDDDDDDVPDFYIEMKVDPTYSRGVGH